jgi:hypothetical protein
MHRREFVRTGLAASALGPAALAAQSAARGVERGTERSATRDAPQERRCIELRTYELRSDLAPGRMRAHLQEQLLPALRRVGAGPAGVFSPESGAQGQSLMLVVEHATPVDAFTLDARLQADASYAAALRAFEGEAQLPYVRYQSQLMRAFSSIPRVETPAARPGGALRLFELRTYESRNTATLARKIDMFDQAELALFRSIGMAPVFFGENVFGTRLPSLTYMVAFDDMAARMQAWATFRDHPDWKRMSQDARWNVEGAVTLAHVALLNPASFSPIR